MFRKLRPRSAYDVMAALSLFLALAGGAAYAANTIRSSDIVDGQVKPQDLAPASKLAGTARSQNQGYCDPQRNQGRLTCGSVGLDLPATASVHMVADTSAHNQGENPAWGLCWLAMDGSKFDRIFTNVNVSGLSSLVSIQTVVRDVPAGRHYFGIECNVEAGELEYENTHFSAVAISNR